MSDADLEMLELEATGDAVAAAARRGECAHMSGQGFHPLVAPDLRPGEIQCTSGCGEIFTSERAWFEAQDFALGDFA